MRNLDQVAADVKVQSPCGIFLVFEWFSFVRFWKYNFVVKFPAIIEWLQIQHPNLNWLVAKSSIILFRFELFSLISGLLQRKWPSVQRRSCNCFRDGCIASPYPHSALRKWQSVQRTASICFSGWSTAATSSSTAFILVLLLEIPLVNIYSTLQLQQLKKFEESFSSLKSDKL